MRWRWRREDGSVTYAELAARASRLAGVLAAAGAGPETVVAVVMDRGVAVITALLAVLKAGAAYLPVDPGYPAERVAFMLRDARPAVIIASAEAAEDLPGLPGVPVLVTGTAQLDAVLAAVPGGGAGGGGRAAAPRPGHLAYVIYTSGSIGGAEGGRGDARGAGELCGVGAGAGGVGDGGGPVCVVAGAGDGSG